MKLFFILAAASLLLVASHATFLEGEREKPMCRKQMRMMEPQLEQCEKYMTMDMMRMPMRRTRGQECRSEDSCMRQCCMAMKEMDEDCACEWMKKMVEEQRGEMGMEEMTMMMMMMMPTKCGMGQMRCDMDFGRRGDDE